MDRFPTELMYVVVFAVIVLFQYLMKRFVQREPQDSPPAEVFQQVPENLNEVPAASSASGLAWGYSGSNGAPGVPSPPPARRFARSSLLGTRREVQNAIVAAAILGPCHAYQPHDTR